MQIVSTKKTYKSLENEAEMGKLWWLILQGITMNHGEGWQKGAQYFLGNLNLFRVRQIL